VLLVLALLVGCAKSLPEDQTFPVYPVKPAATTAVAVVDHRPYILIGEKEEWFEGHNRDTYGMPYSPERPGGRPFAIYLADSLQQSLQSAGGEATVVKMAKGMSVEDAVATMRRQGTDAGLLVLMDQSRYYIYLEKIDYAYRFDVLVLNRSGRTVARKVFEKVEEDIPPPGNYDYFDLTTWLYRRTFNRILDDPEIKKALTDVAAGR